MSYFLHLMSVLLLVAALVWANHLESDDQWGFVFSYLVGILAISLAYFAGILAERENS